MSGSGESLISIEVALHFRSNYLVISQKSPIFAVKITTYNKNNNVQDTNIYIPFNIVFPRLQQAGKDL